MFTRGKGKNRNHRCPWINPPAVSAVSVFRFKGRLQIDQSKSGREVTPNFQTKTKYRLHTK